MQRNGFFMMRGRVPLLGMAMAAAGAGAWLKAFLVTVFGPFFVENIPYSQAFLLEDALKVMQLHCTRSAVHGLVSYLEWANLPHRTPARTLALCLLAPDMKFTLIAPSSTSIFSTSIFSTTFSTSIFSTSISHHLLHLHLLHLHLLHLLYLHTPSCIITRVHPRMSS